MSETQADRNSGSSGRRVLWVVLLAVGLPLLVCGGVGGYIFWWVRGAVNRTSEGVEAGRAAEETCQRFLSQLRTGRPAAAYALTTPKYQANTPRAEFDRLAERHPILGRECRVERFLRGSMAPTFEMPTVPAVGETRHLEFNLFADPLVADEKLMARVTFEIVYQANGMWEVDGFTIP